LFLPINILSQPKEGQHFASTNVNCDIGMRRTILFSNSESDPRGHFENVSGCFVLNDRLLFAEPFTSKLFVSRQIYVHVEQRFRVNRGLFVIERTCLNRDLLEDDWEPLGLNGME
jgi:hypothetical protein